MKISLNWINDFIETNLSSDELEVGLTDLGLECTKEEVGKSYTNVVLGKVQSCIPHPDSDHLSVCEVDTGSENLSTIVCGAPNVKADILVPVAKVGATLENGSFKIKKAKLRGVKSHGMICSGKELQLNSDHDGIMIIESDKNIGTPIEEVIETNSDTIFEIDLTPNRGDCLSHLGVAREIGILEKKQIVRRKVALNEISEAITELISINIESDACYRYASRIVKDVKIGPSPEWLVTRLNSIGQKSINNVVDAANYVLHDAGHPLHTFDLDTIADNTINVRYAKDKEKFKTLDGIERELGNFHLLICDKEKPIALAGIMGGANSEVTTSTTNILLESAYFEPTVIRKGAKKLDVSTEASKRFERDTDIENVVPALEQLATLIQEVAGGEIVKGLIDNYPYKKTNNQINFSLVNCNNFLGTSINSDQVANIFDSLGINYSISENNFTCSVPSYRNDLEREVDLFEEIARVYGYNNIPDSTQFSGSFSAFVDDSQQLDNKVREYLSNRGFCEHYSNSLNSDLEIQQFTSIKPVQIANPLNKDMAFMRNSLFPGLLKAISFNEKRNQNNIQLFEMGAIHKEDAASETQTNEIFNLGIVWYGQSNPHWNISETSADIFSVKGEIESFLETFKIPKIKYIEASTLGFAYSIEIYSRKTYVGRFGLINRKQNSNYDIKHDIFACEFNLANLRSISKNTTFKFREPIQYPSTSRDIALLVDKNISVEMLQKTIKNVGGELLVESRLFDLYEGDKIDNSKKSLAFSLIFQDANKTLNDSTIDSIIQNILAKLSKEHQAIQR